MSRAVDNPKTALRTGVATIRDCGTLNCIVFAVRDAVERGALQGPRIVASSVICASLQRLDWWSPAAVS